MQLCRVKGLTCTVAVPDAVVWCSRIGVVAPIEAVGVV